MERSELEQILTDILTNGLSTTVSVASTNNIVVKTLFNGQVIASSALTGLSVTLDIMGTNLVATLKLNDATISTDTIAASALKTFVT